MTEWYRVAFGEVYPLVYAHRDDAEAERVATAFAPRLGGTGPVLDVACGGGRHTAAFARAGVDTVGVDLSEFLLAEAVQRRGLAGRVVLGDMRSLPFRDGALGGAMNMFTSFGYFDDEADDARALAEVARVLRPDARFLMDFANAASIGEVDVETTRRVEGGVRIEERRECAGRVLTKRVRVVRPDGSDARYEERVRMYTAAELEALLAGVGLQVRARFGDYQAGAFDPSGSSRVILLAEKGGAA